MNLLVYLAVIAESSGIDLADLVCEVLNLTQDERITKTVNKCVICLAAQRVVQVLPEKFKYEVLFWQFNITRSNFIIECYTQTAVSQAVLTVVTSFAD